MSAATGALVERPGGIDRRPSSNQRPNDLEGLQTAIIERAPLAVTRQPEARCLLTLKGLTTATFIGALFGRRRYALSIDVPPDLRKRRTRLILRRADAIFVTDDDLVATIIQAGVPSHLIVSRHTWGPDVFTSVVPYRGVAEAHRLVFAGDLSPFSGAVDLQLCAARWAEHNPERDIDITWVGEGDLHAVLDAQPLPPNMRQRFVGPLVGADLAGVFRTCGLLAVPDLTGSNKIPLREAAAAGLPIIGNSRNPLIRLLVTPGETGWLIDPLKPRTMTNALGDAMSATIDRLNEMRVASRARVLLPLAGWLPAPASATTSS